MKKDDDLCHIYDISLFNIDDLDVLLHEILKQARELLNSEAGSVYINEGKNLSFNIFQNDAMSYEDIYKQFYALKDMKLPLSEHEKYLAVQAFSTGKIILIDDVYEANEYHFLGVKEYDKRFNYRTHSIITAPIIHPLENKTLGVVQLINKKDEDNNTVSYDEKDKQMLSMVSSFIALAISNAQNNIQKLKNLNTELEVANEKLRDRINYEVEQNEKKSVIMHHQSKLASLGEMIGNIAHQWRQPLSAISTMASGLSINIEMGNYKEKDALNHLDNIVTTTKHLSQTIDDFRSFYKIDKVESNFNLSKNITQSLSIINATLIESEIDVILNLDEKIEVYGYENELKQAILNIIQNAKDALVEKRDEDRIILIDLYKNSEFIYIKIKDNANGIKKQYLDKVFEQNFTTKEKSGGTGIGLFMTEQIIVKNMDGSLKVKNKKFTFNEKDYKGAQFTLRFKLDSDRNL